MSSAIVTRNDAIEAALVQGDLSKLSTADRLAYYRNVCESLGLNPLTKPFEYITLNNKLTLYARKGCTDQLRDKKGVSIAEPKIQFEDEWIIVSVIARLPDGRTDADVGVVNRKDMRGDFGNAIMKAVTKAKRRVTLSICGLGMLDETEVETIPGARHVDQPAGHDPETPLDEPPAFDPVSEEDFRTLLAQKRWTYAGALRSIDAVQGTTYRERNAKYAELDPKIAADFFDWLREQPASKSQPAGAA